MRFRKIHNKLFIKAINTTNSISRKQYNMKLKKTNNRLMFTTKAKIHRITIK